MMKSMLIGIIMGIIKSIMNIMMLGIIMGMMKSIITKMIIMSVMRSIMNMIRLGIRRMIRLGIRRMISSRNKIIRRKRLEMGRLEGINIRLISFITISMAIHNLITFHHSPYHLQLYSSYHQYYQISS